MSSDTPTFAEVGEENIRERQKRGAEERMWHRVWKDNEYDRL